MNLFNRWASQKRPAPLLGPAPVLAYYEDAKPIGPLALLVAHEWARKALADAERRKGNALATIEECECRAADLKGAIATLQAAAGQKPQGS